MRAALFGVLEGFKKNASMGWLRKRGSLNAKACFSRMTSWC